MKGKNDEHSKFKYFETWKYQSKCWRLEIALVEIMNTRIGSKRMRISTRNFAKTKHEWKVMKMEGVDYLIVGAIIFILGFLTGGYSVSRGTEKKLRELKEEIRKYESENRR